MTWTWTEIFKFFILLAVSVALMYVLMVKENDASQARMKEALYQMAGELKVVWRQEAVDMGHAYWTCDSTGTGTVLFVWNATVTAELPKGVTYAK